MRNSVNVFLIGILRWKPLPVLLAIFLYLLIYLLRFEQGGWNPKLDLFANQRQVLDQIIASLLPSPQSELLSGIILGTKKELPPKLKLDLRDTSTLHIVVVSGQNLSMVAGFFLSLSGLIKRKVAIALSFLAILLYTLLTGAQVPVLRAAIMVSMSFLAQVFGRQKDGVWILMITAALMLLINPAWIFDLSFELSFLATFGVVIITPILLKYFKVLPVIGQDLSVTIGAQMMIIPIIAHNFHQFSLVGVATNLLVLWTVPIIMILGMVVLAAGAISNFLGSSLALIVSIFLTYFIYIVQFFASLPFAWEYVGEQVWLVWVGYYMVLGGILLAISRTKENVKTKT